MTTTKIRVFTTHQRSLERWAIGRGLNPGGISRVSRVGHTYGLPRGTEIHLVHPFMEHPDYKALLLLAEHRGIVLIQED